MLYSYESWHEEATGSETVLSAQSDLTERSFPFSEELKELERNLSLDVEAGMRLYRQHQQVAQAGLSQSGSSADKADAPEWDELARLVADHVLAYMMDNPLQADLAAMRRKNERFYEDNRVMAKQVQDLLAENDTLRAAAHAMEHEVARYRQLIGNLYLKQ